MKILNIIKNWYYSVRYRSGMSMCMSMMSMEIFRFPKGYKYYKRYIETCDDINYLNQIIENCNWTLNKKHIKIRSKAISRLEYLLNNKGDD